MVTADGTDTFVLGKRTRRRSRGGGRTRAKKTKPTKQTKRSKRTKRKSSKPPVSVEPECTVELVLTDAVFEEPETMRRLAHRVVDLLADTGRYTRLSKSVSNNLAYLVNDFVIDKVTELLEEARAAGKEVPRG